MILRTKQRHLLRIRANFHVVIQKGHFGVMIGILVLFNSVFKNRDQTAKRQCWNPISLF